MPYISNEALAGAALLVVLAVGYQWIPKAGEAGAGKKSASKKKNKKKSAAKAVAVDGSPSVGSMPGSVAGTATSSVAPSEAESEGGKKKKGKGKGNAADASLSSSKPSPAPTPSPAPPAESSPESSTSFADAAREPAKPKLLAEKLLPKPRKTIVDDMLEPEDRPPQIARVMKVVSPNSPTTASTEKVAKYEDDYADSTSDSVTDEQLASEDEWNVVSSKKKPMSLSIGSSSASSSAWNSTETQTKLQRKNQKKAEAKKAQKAADEADRLRRLAMHKRDLERQRIDEIYKSYKVNKVVKQNGKVVSGGAAASVSENGRLVWE